MNSPTSRQLDQIFELLRHPHRRYALRHLRNESTPIGTELLAKHIAKREVDGIEHIRRVHTALYHTHLPKLADAGIVTFASQRGDVALDELDGVTPFLDEIVSLDLEEVTS